MIYETDSSALHAAIDIIEAHGLVVIKIIFGNKSEADLFVDNVVRYLHNGDWQWQQNGTVVAFIVDKMVATRDILDGSGHYIVRTWLVA